MSKYVRQEKSLRKHPVACSAMSPLRAPDVPVAPRERPGWKGPGFVKKAPKQAARAVQAARRAENVQVQHLDPAVQQSLLNVFRTALPVCEDYEALKPTLEAIRGAVCEGSYQMAFWREDWLEAYAVRWSPNRALCVATVLVDLGRELVNGAGFEDILRVRDERAVDGAAPDASNIRHAPLSAVCFGGGAAEVMAFAALSRHFWSQTATCKLESVTADSTAAISDRKSTLVDLHLLDQADWAPVISSLQAGLHTPPVLSKYASQAAKDRNAPFVAPGVLKTTFTRRDVLQLNQEDIRALVGSQPTLITICFTLNDLHLVSKAKTASFLMKLGLGAHEDSLLLIIDNSLEAEKSDEQNDRKWSTFSGLLDLIIMDKKACLWKELVRDQNRVFKLEKGLNFPVSLENQRVQIHLFKRLPK